jgi:hypothetical protein
LFGSYRLDGQDPTIVTRTDELWIRYAPESDFEWLYDNRGGVALGGDSGVLRHAIRAFEYRSAAGVLLARIEAIGQDRVDSVHRKILPGDDLVVTASGTPGLSCQAYDDAGHIVDDPLGTRNPLCLEFMDAP